MSKLHVSDVGAFRGAKSREEEAYIDEGDDGMLWLPKNKMGVKNLAVITDGVGSLAGSGMHDIARFEKFLEGVENTRHAVREAFFRSCGPPSQSTIASLWLPQTFEQKGLILHAGDSHVLRLREKRGYDTLEVLTKEHSMWDLLLESKSSYLRKKRQQLEKAECVDDLAFLTDAGDVYGLILELENELHSSGEEIFHYDPETCTLNLLHHVLLFKMKVCKYTFYLYLGDHEDDVKDRIGNGKNVDVRPGDRFVLLTDGIYPDVLFLEEMLDVLVTTRDSAKEAARQLVFMSDDTIDTSGMRVKDDDRAALVLDLSSKPSKHPILSPLKTSLGDEIGRYRYRQTAQ